MFSKLIIFILCLFLPIIAGGANIYVDQTLGSNITNGTYSIANRDNSGSDGNAYTTIQAAITAMNGGDDIYMRGGEYDVGDTAPEGRAEAIQIPHSKSGTSDNYSSLRSYPGEWAIIDGENDCGTRGVGLGLYVTAAESTSETDLNYWIFERFELKNCRSVNTQDGATFSWGIYASGGPNIFRYIYFHDITSDGDANVPAALSGNHWHDCIVEYCYFNNNGTATNLGDNASHLSIWSDYLHTYWRTNAFNLEQSTQPTYRNKIRYNYFVGGNMGFSHKAQQLLSGRSTGLDDTYIGYGDELDHNILIGQAFASIMVDQDFVKVHNNILDKGAASTNYGLYLGYTEELPNLYKASAWNNTLIGCTEYGIVRYNWTTAGDSNPAYEYGCDFNNILSTIGHNAHWVPSADIVVAPNLDFNLSGYYGANNLSYNPTAASAVYGLKSTDYSTAQYNAQTLTHTPRTHFTSTASNLFAGATGADKYTLYGSGSFSDGLGEATAATAGYGLAHPYLSGVTIPSYIGAVNPSDNDWVAGVLDMDATYFTSATSGATPSWIEGAGSAASPPTIQNGFISNGGFR